MNFEIKILIWVSLLYNFGAGFFTPIYAIFVNNIGGSIIDAGIAWSIYSIALGVLLIFFGKLEDIKLDKAKMVFIGYFIIAICTLGYIVIQTPLQLFILQFIIGVGAAILSPAWYSLFGIHGDRGNEASEWAYWDGGRSISIGIAALFGGLIVYNFGWPVLFITMFVFQICAAFLALKIIFEKEVKVK